MKVCGIFATESMLCKDRHPNPGNLARFVLAGVPRCIAGKTKECMNVDATV